MKESVMSYNEVISRLTKTVNGGSGTISAGNTLITTTGTNTAPSYFTLQHTGPELMRLESDGNIVNPHEDYASFKAYMDKYKASANPTTASESLEKMISDMEGSENELQQNAVKHMKYAKAYLDKMMLEIINERL